MTRALDEEVRTRLVAYAEEVGGLAVAGRRMDIPADTLRRAAAGERLRRATRVLIKSALDEAQA